MWCKRFDPSDREGSVETRIDHTTLPFALHILVYMSKRVKIKHSTAQLLPAPKLSAVQLLIHS